MRIAVYLSPNMNMMQVVSDFLIKAKELSQRMRSPEGKTLSTGDLHILREQLRLLDAEAEILLSKKNKD
jgi:hypothetical protein